MLEHAPPMRANLSAWPGFSARYISPKNPSQPAASERTKKSGRPAWLAPGPEGQPRKRIGRRGENRRHRERAGGGLCRVEQESQNRRFDAGRLNGEFDSMGERSPCCSITPERASETAAPQPSTPRSHVMPRSETRGTPASTPFSSSTSRVRCAAHSGIISSSVPCTISTGSLRSGG